MDEDEKGPEAPSSAIPDVPSESGSAPEHGPDALSNEKKEQNKPLIVAVALVLVVLAAGLFFLLRTGSSIAVSGSLTAPSGGECDAKSIEGVSAAMVNGNGGEVLAQSQFTPRPSGEDCLLSFEFSLPREDSYQLQVRFPKDMQADIGTDHLNGPKYSFDELSEMDFHITASVADFAPPGQDGGTGEASPDTAAEYTLRNGIAAAKTYFTDSDSYKGTDAKTLSAVEPSLKWTDNGPATVGEVSIRGVSGKTVVLVTKSESGTVFCIGDDVTTDLVMGKVDAKTVEECTGGW